ncbi:type IV pilus biogenesis/stability protein PilW [Hahella ganghwensis]|uniref:type IV pilus biogenesis/stability protein PilW n=1 Tax=Hahella ganghwensis TaxID=286420 RepID=UPI00036A70C2|nr:type IV pilus biogenesis/stability protein PilW [Hahella ganghwensis]
MVYTKLIANTERTTGFLRLSCLRRLSLLIIVQFLFVSGCVTTVEGPYRAKASKSKAAEQYVQLGLAYFQNREYDRATEKLSRALELEPQNATAHAALGLVYQAQDEPEHAEEEFRTALRHDPNYTRGRTYFGAFLYQQGRLKDSLNQFRLASEDIRYESRAQIFSNMGLIHVRLNQVDEAINAYEKSLTLRRDQVNAYLALSNLYYDTEDLSRADRYYQVYWDRVRSGQASHTAQSLALGINIARDKKDRNEEASLTLLLKNLFPESMEYQKIKESS